MHVEGGGNECGRKQAAGYFLSPGQVAQTDVQSWSLIGAEDRGQPPT